MLENVQNYNDRKPQKLKEKEKRKMKDKTILIIYSDDPEKQPNKEYSLDYQLYYDMTLKEALTRFKLNNPSCVVMAIRYTKGSLSL